MPSTVKYTRQQKHPQLLPKKFIPQQTFTIYPYITSKPTSQHPFMIIPSRSQWFNLNSVNQIQKKALPEWFRQKKGVMATMNNIKFEKNEELYKKYRNYIIEMGKVKYINPTMSRKGLAGDACAIIRIHEFLEKWGLINLVHKKNNPSTLGLKDNKEHQHQQQQPVKTIKNSENNINHSHPHFHPSIKLKDGFNRDKSLIAKIYQKDDLQLLRKITKCFRPLCTSCSSLCGIAWYEYSEILTKKSFPLQSLNSQQQQQQSSQTTTTVFSHQSFPYHLTTCFSCYAQKNYPVVLAPQDFTKKSIIDQITSINFDQTYGKKKTQEWLRVAQAVEKTRFGIGRCSQMLKMGEKEVVDVLLQMPVINLEKISRIEQETEDQEDQINKDEKNNQIKDQKQQNESSCNQADHTISTQTQDLVTFHSTLSHLTHQQHKHYQQFLQSWLLKLYSKLQQLQQWDKAIQWKLHQNEAIKKHNLAEKLRKCIKTNDE